MSESLDTGTGSGAESLSVDPQPQIATIELNVLIKYVRQVIPVLLEDDATVHPSFEALLQDQTSIERFRKFITDGQVKSLLIQRSSAKGY